MQKKPDTENKLIAEARKQRELREQGYREQALKLYPPVCSRCGREFSGKKLRELTVHHRNHNHDDNPPDGSNWELLCLYCHDNEHQKYLLDGTAAPDSDPDAPATYQPFANLKDLLKGK
ncbi:MAG: YajD family HNH nuclease [Nitrospiraceae bacterium]|nr:YajD family HNH nuclease [Nitrospiraceae bacterium]